METINATPGQKISLILIITDVNGVRIDSDDALLPVPILPQITQILIPAAGAWSLDITTVLPVDMTRLGVGVYAYNYQVPPGGIAIGTYLIDAEYIVNTISKVQTFQIIVNAPLGMFSMSLT
jgi:hypothetical protein